MKKQISALLIATLLSPLVCFAQPQSGEPTRAQVQSELAKLESVGYRPVAEDFSYPQSIQDAEVKVAALDQHNSPHSAAVSATRNPGQSTANAQ